VHLTGIGRDFLPQAARIVGDMTAAIERLKDISRLGKGDVTIASIPTMAHHALPAVMRAYADRCPGNRIRIIESSASEVRRTVLQDQADFGITLELGRELELSEQRILREPFMFFCRVEHALSTRRTVTWKDVRETELIMVGGQSGNRALLDYQLARRRLSLRPRYEVEHLSTAIGLVTAGVGTAILPSSTILEGANPLVRGVPIVAPVIRRTVILIRKRRNSLSPAAQIFHDMLAANPPARGSVQLSSRAALEPRTKTPRVRRVNP
jgi:DNA-binding transcriptional LysR family regulator